MGKKKWKQVYTRVPPLTYSVKAKATSPSMANLPFHISASEVMNPSDLDSAVTPLNNGIRDASDSTMLVPRNNGIPPLDIWVNTSWPLDSSTARAATKPTIANLPLILSGAGPLKANTSENFVLTFGAARNGEGFGLGFGVELVTGVVGCSFWSSCKCKNESFNWFIPHISNLKTRKYESMNFRTYLCQAPNRKIGIPLQARHRFYRRKLNHLTPIRKASHRTCQPEGLHDTWCGHFLARVQLLTWTRGYQKLWNRARSKNFTNQKLKQANAT